ncbi:hypothetical protein [Paraglaciecola arctica]|uniref:Uncharacterized protein n=1 Tax=Paraglaciecola arctica BSs20135 TaxID=493475 RepID=K6YVV7_9ALTE|nr:hypothetical protein [Paraglaciecola arctica]GAC22287.1 hypothetical protein GARC_5352 [Paraglaciecola arctica BSs20135]
MTSLFYALPITKKLVDKTTTKVNQLDDWPTEVNGIVQKWNVNVKDVEGDFLLTPDLPEQSSLASRLSTEKKWITLIPYGATKLRLTVFPQANKE